MFFFSESDDWRSIVMKKKLVSVFTAVMMLFVFSITAFAESDQDVSVVPMRYSYTNIVSSRISFSGHTATCRSVVEGKSSVTKIEITQCLEEDIGGGWWYRIASWTKTFYDNYATYTNTKSSVPSGTYHTRTIATVYVGSNSECITAYSTTASC